MNERLKKILCTGTKILVCLAAIPVFFFLLVFFSEALSPESFLKRPSMKYHLESSRTDTLCTEQEMPVQIPSSHEYNHIFVRGTLHAYYPFHLKGETANDQPFVLDIHPFFESLGYSWNNASISCITLPPIPPSYTFDTLHWTLLIDELVEQNTAPVGPALVRSQAVKKLTLWENPYWGTLLTFALYGLGFAFFTRRVFRNPNPTVPPTCKLFLFPFIVALLLSPLRLFSVGSPLSLPAPLFLDIPYPFWFTYPLILICYGICVLAVKEPRRPNDFWSRMFFFFFAEGFLSWIFCLSFFGLSTWDGWYPLFPLRPL